MTPDTRTHRIARLLRKLYGAKRVEIIVELKNGRLRFSYPDRWPELVAACEKTKEEAANAEETDTGGTP